MSTLPCPTTATLSPSSISRSRYSCEVGPPAASASAANASLPVMVFMPCSDFSRRFARPAAHTTSSVRQDTICARSPERIPSGYRCTIAFCELTPPPPRLDHPPSRTRPACRNHRGAAASIVCDREGGVESDRGMGAQRSPDVCLVGGAAGHHAPAARAALAATSLAAAEGIHQPAPPDDGPDSGAAREPAVDRRPLLVAVSGGVHGVPGAGRAVAGPSPLAGRRSDLPRLRNVSQRGLPVLDDSGSRGLAAADRRARHRRELLRRRHRRGAGVPDRAAVALGLSRRGDPCLRHVVGGKARLHPTRPLQCAASRTGLLPLDATPTRRGRCVDSALWRSTTRTSVISVAAWNSRRRRWSHATNRSAHCWSTPTATSGSRTATRSRTVTPLGTPSSRSRAGPRRISLPPNGSAPRSTPRASTARCAPPLTPGSDLAASCMRRRRSS